MNAATKFRTNSAMISAIQRRPRGSIGGLGCGGAPRPSGAGSTRQPLRSSVDGGRCGLGAAGGGGRAAGLGGKGGGGAGGLPPGAPTPPQARGGHGGGGPPRAP